jgi:hypothetical protein
MVAGHYLYEPGVAVQAALSRGAGLPEQLTAEIPVGLYAAALSGEAWVLGRHQLAAQVRKPTTTSPAFVRASGGAAVRAGEGVLYVALALHDRSTLLPCPAGRLLNRNVRGVLTGLRQLGLSINYFGRDFLSCGAQPAVYVGWDARTAGHVLLEFFIAHESAWFVPDQELNYPPRAEAALRGRAPITLHEALRALGKTLGAEDIAQAIALGHSQAFGVRWNSADTPLPAPAPQQAPEVDPTEAPTDRLVWSVPREEAIGFVSAGVRLDSCGKFAEVRLVGDFFAHRACKTALEQLLLGTSPSEQWVGEAVDATFTRSGYDVEGIRKLSVFRDAIMEAAMRSNLAPT